MAQEFNLPNLGENIKAGDLVRVLVKEGDRVEKDQSVIEVETDKAALEVPIPFAGVVQKIHVKEGQKVAVGQLILTVDGAGAPSPTPPEKKAPEAKKESPKEDIRAAQPKPPVSTGEEPALVKTPASPPMLEEKPAPKAAKPAAPESKPSSSPETDPADLLAAPSVRRFAREMGVRLQDVKGTGTGGRITEDDIKEFVRNLQEEKQSPTVTGHMTSFKELPDFSKWGGIERKPMSSIRRKTAENMTYAWTTIPHVTQFDSADITEVMNLRKKFSKRVEQAGGKLTITAILLKVCASALKVFPQFNASLDLEKEEIIYKKYFNIGVAADTDRGLIVPVIRDVDRKNILQLSVELTQVSEKARLRKTSLEEMQGSSFTITNLGSIGGTHFTPIINAPDVAILGVGQGVMQPVYEDGQWMPRMILPLSLSYDHRLIDGADAARFLRWLASAVQEPFLMDLEG